MDMVACLGFSVQALKIEKLSPPYSLDVMLDYQQPVNSME